jgi:L-alanine-DL-glutamate epimerase-like enolase superfamily enzyme
MSTDFPRINAIELTPLLVPFNAVVREAMQKAGGLGMAIPAEEDWTGGDFAICKMTDEEGNTGLGEQFVWWPETGVSPKQIILAVQEILHKYVLGQSPFAYRDIRTRMNNNVARSETAKGLLDMALWDLMGKLSKKPACDLMGGRQADTLEAGALIPLMDASAMADMAQEWQKAGYRTIRLKLGKGANADKEIVQAVRERLGTEALMRVDYNQAYCPKDALEAIKTIEPYGIELAEQPVAATDFLGMAYVQQRVDTPLMSHEGCFSLQDIETLTALGAVRIIGINSERPGGVTNALDAIDFADRHGMGVIIHNQTLGIADAMMIHLAAARYHSLSHAVELFGHVMYEDDLILEPHGFNGGQVNVPGLPGWGVRLDEAALEKYATGPTVLIRL